MAIFKNAKNIAEGRIASERSAKVFFWVSTLTGAVFLFVLSTMVIKGSDFEAYIFGSELLGVPLAVASKTAIGIASVYAAFYFDRNMVMPEIKLFFTELGGLVGSKNKDNGLRKFDKFRIVSLVGTGIKFVGLIVITSLISFWGGSITASFFVPIPDVIEQNDGAKREAYIRTATAHEADNLAKIETARDAAAEKAKTQIDEDVQKVANSKRRGNASAKKVVNDAAAAAAAPFSKQVAALDAKLSSAREAAAKRYDATEVETLAKSKALFDSAQSRSKSLNNMLTYIGLICVGLGVVSIGTQSMGEVSDEIQSATKSAQAGDDFMRQQKQQANRQHANP